ncbi:MAG: recombinase family protein [Hyphomonadaceae bacterium]
MVERFDAHNLSFVSVTQSFNTTTSMGRLTLNVLLSFAQFEREVTGERIRDKIAASKARGLWMGGTPPLGYAPNGRTLTIIEPEAATVRMIYQRYLELGSVHALKDDLEDRGVRSKQWITQKGKTTGGGIFGRGALYHLLRNRLYLGEIMHRGQSHPGQHQAILSVELFDAVQAKLEEARVAVRQRPAMTGGSPLTGKVFDAGGAPMSPAHARGRSNKAHRYYVSKPLLTGKREAPYAMRIPALALEALVAERTRNIVVPFDWVQARAILKRVIVHPDRIALSFSCTLEDYRALQPIGEDQLSFADNICTLVVQARIKRISGAVRLLDPRGRNVTGKAQQDPSLLRALGRGRHWRAQLLSGAVKDAATIAAAEGVTKAIVYRHLKLAYLAPDLVRDILDGRQRAGLALRNLLKMDLPLDWRAQRRVLGASRDAER